MVQRRVAERADHHASSGHEHATPSRAACSIAQAVADGTRQVRRDRRRLRDHRQRRGDRRPCADRRRSAPPRPRPCRAARPRHRRARPAPPARGRSHPSGSGAAPGRWDAARVRRRRSTRDRRSRSCRSRASAPAASARRGRSRGCRPARATRLPPRHGVGTGSAGARSPAQRVDEVLLERVEVVGHARTLQRVTPLRAGSRPA